MKYGKTKYKRAKRPILEEARSMTDGKEKELKEEPLA